MKNLILYLSKMLSLLALLFFTACTNGQTPDDKEYVEFAEPETEQVIEKQLKGFTDANVPAFKKRMEENPDAVILDVRTPGEFEQGYIPGAVNIDVQGTSFYAAIDTLDKSKTYLVYCRSGQRSSTACRVMSEKGFENLVNLQGGYLDWVKAQEE